MGQVRGPAAQVGGKSVGAAVVQGRVVGGHPERLGDRPQDRRGRRLVAGDGHGVGVDHGRLIPRSAAAATTSAAARPWNRHLERVEEVLVRDLEAAGAQPAGQGERAAVHAGRDRGQALGTVVDGVGAGHHGEQHLRGADVAGRLLPADVLLPGLQRQAVGDVAVGVHRDTDQAPRQLAGQPLADGEVPAAVRRSPSGRRSAGWCRRRRRRPTPPVPRAASAPAGPRRRPTRPPRAPRPRAPGDRGPRRWRPDRTAGRRTRRLRQVGRPAPDRSATCRAMPSGSARVCSTPRVCGRVSASTTKTAPGLARPARRTRVIASPRRSTRPASRRRRRRGRSGRRPSSGS